VIPPDCTTADAKREKEEESVAHGSPDCGAAGSKRRCPAGERSQRSERDRYSAEGEPWAIIHGLVSDEWKNIS